MKNIDQLPMVQLYRIRGTDKIFDTIQQAALDLGEVTYNKNYRGRQLGKRYSVYSDRVGQLRAEKIVSRVTLFKEIECIHRPLTGKMLDLVKLPGESKKIGLDALGKLLYDAIYKFISENWESDKMHVMSHSSGFDSRTVSLVLNALRKERGDAWLGEMRFICWEPEITDFKTIMTHQGWSEDQLILVDPGRTVDYHARHLDFAFLGGFCSEADRFLPQEGLFHEIVAGLCAPEDLQVVTGNHCDEVMDENWKNYGHYFLKYLSDTAQNRNKFYSYITPYVSHDVLSILVKYNISIPTRVPTKKALIRYKDPKLATLKNFTPQQYRKRNQIKCELLSPDTVNKMTSDFKNSWYFKTFKPAVDLPFPGKIIYKNKTAKQYLRAAMCEHLLSEGVTIKC